VTGCLACCLAGQQLLLMLDCKSMRCLLKSEPAVHPARVLYSSVSSYLGSSGSFPPTRNCTGQLKSGLIPTFVSQEFIETKCCLLELRSRQTVGSAVLELRSFEHRFNVNRPSHTMVRMSGSSECTAVSMWLPVLLNPEKPVMCEPQYAEASWYH
jgi:hypothetical protein